VASAVSIPVIGMGGIAQGAEALDFIAAGASAVAIGTENFRDPAAGERVSRELQEALAKCGFTAPGDARGRANESEKGLETADSADATAARTLDLKSRSR
jgi:dihydroorotate dehydrogenase (NAD+) catalytic subunit